MLNLPIPSSNAPLPRPRLDGQEHSSNEENHSVRWGDGETATFEHGEKYFKTEEDVYAFHPLQHADMREWQFVVNNYDYSDEERLYRFFRDERFGLPKEWGDKAPEFSAATADHYNTMIMWPMLTFGWEMFLSTCLDEEFEPLMEEFAELNRRAFRAYSRLPINFFISHDDIASTGGPICSPQWMNKYIFPRYEEYWGMLKAAGKEVIFMVDGNIDFYADDVMACGARGIISEPYTDYKAIARKHKDAFLAGEGDNRILMRNNPDEIRKMVERMAQTARMSGGYMMCIGNHIPWNVPADAIKRYIDLSRELAVR
jgi:hypothetical protein